MRIRATVDLAGPFGTFKAGIPFDPGDERIGRGLIAAGLAVEIDVPAETAKEETAEAPPAPETATLRRGKTRR